MWLFDLFELTANSWGRHRCFLPSGGHPRRTWKDEIYTAMNGRDLRMGEWNNRRQWNMKVKRRRETL